MTVSVIMPVYKVEQYVGRAIESVQKQTLTDWELWAVDDGSPDNCGQICDRYAAADARIHVIHKENGGAHSARNVAIKQATGKYFFFMDSDDWAEPEMLEQLVALAEKNQSQLVIAGYYVDTYSSETDFFSRTISQPSEVFATQQDFRLNAYRLFNWQLLYVPWNKLYLAQYVKSNGLFFPATQRDDFPFNLSVMRDVERVCLTEKAYYHFLRKRAESETAKYNPKLYEKREEEHRWMTDLYAYWGIGDENSQEMLARRYIERLVGCVENVTNGKCTLSAREKKQQIEKMISTDACRWALKLARPRSGLMKLMLIPIKMHLVGLTYLEGKFISWVKSNSAQTFAKLEARRIA